MYVGPDELHFSKSHLSKSVIICCINMCLSIGVNIPISIDEDYKTHNDKFIIYV